MNKPWGIALLGFAALAMALAVHARQSEAKAGNAVTDSAIAGTTLPAGASSGAANPAADAAIGMAREALDRVVANYQVDRGRIRDLVKGAQGFAVFQDVFKGGLILAPIHGHGFLVYRQPDGRWGPPLMLEVHGTSVGPQIGARMSDVLVVFKTGESIQKLLTGQWPHGLTTPSGSVLYGSADTASLPPGITTYSLHRGLMLGQSIDEYHLTLQDQTNLSLYGQPLKSGDLLNIKRVGLRLPAPVQLFVEHVNKQLGEPPEKVEWAVGGAGQ